MSPTPDTPESTPRFRQEFCPKCDYSLQGLSEAAVCPECGFQVDPNFIVLRGRPLGAESSLFRGSNTNFAIATIFIVGASLSVMLGLFGPVTLRESLVFGMVIVLTFFALLYRISNPNASRALIWIHDLGIVQTGVHDRFWNHPIVITGLPLIGVSVYPFASMVSSRGIRSIGMIILFLLVLSFMMGPVLIDRIRARSARVHHGRSDAPPLYPWAIFKFVQIKPVFKNRWRVRAVMASKLAAPSLVHIETLEDDRTMTEIRNRIREIAPQLEVRG